MISHWAFYIGSALFIDNAIQKGIGYGLKDWQYWILYLPPVFYLAWNLF